MSQIARKWIADRAIDHTKLDSSDSFTMAGLTVTGDATVTGNLIIPALNFDQSNNFPAISVNMTGDAPGVLIVNDPISLGTPGLQIDNSAQYASISIENTRNRSQGIVITMDSPSQSDGIQIFGGPTYGINIQDSVFGVSVSNSGVSDFNGDGSSNFGTVFTQNSVLVQPIDNPAIDLTMNGDAPGIQILNDPLSGGTPALVIDNSAQSASISIENSLNRSQGIVITMDSGSQTDGIQVFGPTTGLNVQGTTFGVNVSGSNVSDFNGDGTSQLATIFTQNAVLVQPIDNPAIDLTMNGDAPGISIVNNPPSLGTPALIIDNSAQSASISIENSSNRSQGIVITMDSGSQTDGIQVFGPTTGLFISGCSFLDIDSDGTVSFNTLIANGNAYLNTGFTERSRSFNAGEWDQEDATITTDSGTASFAGSILRYSVIGKTVHLIGNIVYNVTSGTPGKFFINYPASFPLDTVNAAKSYVIAPNQLSDDYGDQIYVGINQIPDTAHIQLFKVTYHIGATFSGSAQIDFQCFYETSAG